MDFLRGSIAFSFYKRKTRVKDTSVEETSKEDVVEKINKRFQPFNSRKVQVRIIIYFNVHIYDICA